MATLFIFLNLTFIKPFSFDFDINTTVKIKIKLIKTIKKLNEIVILEIKEKEGDLLICKIENDRINNVNLANKYSKENTKSKKNNIIIEENIKLTVINYLTKKLRYSIILDENFIIVSRETFKIIMSYHHVFNKSTNKFSSEAGIADLDKKTVIKKTENEKNFLFSNLKHSLDKIGIPLILKLSIFSSLLILDDFKDIFSFLESLDFSDYDFKGSNYSGSTTKRNFYFPVHAISDEITLHFLFKIRDALDFNKVTKKNFIKKFVECLIEKIIKKMKKKLIPNNFIYTYDNTKENRCSKIENIKLNLKSSYNITQLVENDDLFIPESFPLIINEFNIKLITDEKSQKNDYETKLQNLDLNNNNEVIKMSNNVKLLKLYLKIKLNSKFLKFQLKYFLDLELNENHVIPFVLPKIVKKKLDDYRNFNKLSDPKFEDIIFYKAKIFSQKKNIYLDIFFETKMTKKDGILGKMSENNNLDFYDGYINF